MQLSGRLDCPHVASGAGPASVQELPFCPTPGVFPPLSLPRGSKTSWRSDMGTSLREMRRLDPGGHQMVFDLAYWGRRYA